MNIINIIIICSFIILLIVVLISLLTQFSQPTCRLGQAVTNLSSGQTRTTPLTYIPGIEVCHDTTSCNNSQAPCVYSNLTGTTCPGDIGYTGLLPNNTTYTCLNKQVCPTWSSIGFQDYKEFFVQSDTDVDICGLTTDNLTRMWPSNCVRGRLGLNINDNLWYCMSTTLDCPVNNNLVIDTQYNFVCLPK